MGEHIFHLGATEPQISNEHGSRVQAGAGEFPILDRLSLALLKLAPGAFREPHWHANANEFTYCAAGESLVTIFGDSNRHSVFSVSPGQAFFVPSGALHAIENVGDEEAEFVVCFSHERPQDFGLSGSVGMLTPNVMGNTWGLDGSELAGLPEGPDDTFAGKVDGPPEIPDSASFDNDLKLDVEGLPPLIDDERGSLRTARLDTWPVLDGLAMYSLRIAGDAMREPHWHPETAELGYVRTGRARMTVKSADGSVDTYELAAGDIYFIPRAFPHHIENLENEETHFLVFFDQAEVRDIGYTGSTGAYPPRILAPTLGMAAGDLPELPPMPDDLLLVKKRNPVDP